MTKYYISVGSLIGNPLCIPCFENGRITWEIEKAPVGQFTIFDYRTSDFYQGILFRSEVVKAPIAANLFGYIGTILTQKNTLAELEAQKIIRTTSLGECYGIDIPATILPHQRVIYQATKPLVVGDLEDRSSMEHLHSWAGILRRWRSSIKR